MSGGVNPGEASGGEPVTIIGAGLAGSEAAWTLARRGVPVRLCEMRPGTTTPAHRSGDCAELVCSNSLRSDDPERNAVGLLHQEMRTLDSLVMTAADFNRVPAGGALAVDREAFSQWITAHLDAHPLIERIAGEVQDPPEEGWVLIASGPLTSDALAARLERETGAERLAFYDAIAPIVAHDSIDFSKAWKQSRYGKGEGDDYINCPLDRQQYDDFLAGLAREERVPLRGFEKEIEIGNAKAAYFEGCLPIEVMADRGAETLRFGPMKPVGLNNPHTGGAVPHAVVQLRQDNRLGTLWNMVGFQTKLTWPAQQRLFRTIPGLEQAEFLRLGALHRNTFIHSPTLLDSHLRLKSRPNWLFAGQITGVEGYVESAAMGLIAGLFLVDLIAGRAPTPPPPTTACGALLAYITQSPAPENGRLVKGSEPLGAFQPMNVNFGLFPPLAGRMRKKERKPALAKRANSDLSAWIRDLAPVSP